MSVAFTREESAETAAEVELSDRPISSHPNLVTASGLEALTNAMAESRAAYDMAQKIEDAGERRRAAAVASRDMRYFVDRLRTAQLVAPPAEFGVVSFGHRVTFRRDDGRRQHGGMAGYTSVGIGSSVVPARFNNRPEITLHQLVCGDHS